MPRKDRQRRSAKHRVQVRRCDDLALIQDLERSNPDRDRILPGLSQWWVARNARGVPVGYAGARLVPGGSCYLAWARVLKAARGKGLQRRLIRARVSWARRQGCRNVFTYTAPHNAPSMRSLIACGFKPYDPKHPWVGRDWVYWIKKL